MTELKKLITITSAVSLLLGLTGMLLYKKYANSVFLALTITFYTTFYHITMRIFVGYLVNIYRYNKKDSLSFSLSRTEKTFYEKINIKHWKKYAPTYNKQSFSVKENSYAELMHNMRNAEIGHLIISILSFAPLLLSKPLDGFIPFFITSVLADVFDMQFVFIQRYNMSRLSRTAQLASARRLK